MNNKKKFLGLVSDEKTDTIKRNRDRIRNRAMLKESQKIALKVLMRLDELQWSQRHLAELMEVSPQQISKIVSGKENLTLETQIKLQDLLLIPILASFYEKQSREEEMSSLTFNSSEEYTVVQPPPDTHYSSGEIIENFVTEKPEEYCYEEAM